MSFGHYGSNMNLQDFVVYGKEKLAINKIDICCHL